MTPPPDDLDARNRRLGRALLIFFAAFFLLCFLYVGVLYDWLGLRPPPGTP